MPIPETDSLQDKSGFGATERTPTNRLRSALRPIRYALWGGVTLAILMIGGFELWHAKQTEDSQIPPEAMRSAIKTDFVLIDHTGKAVTHEDYRGKWLLVFFGFTNCPDVCPTALNEVAQVMAGLGDQAAMMQPLFVSIDPERDTPKRMAEFVAAFDPRIVGLTGTPEQVKAAAKSFRAFYAKAAQKGAPGGYTMEHSTVIYLIDPKGLFIRSYSYETTPEEVLDDLRNWL